MKTMENKKTTILKCIIFILLLSLAVIAVSWIFQDKNSIRKNKEFFSHKSDYDVLFFGSSHMELFADPMMLWKEYGITSYNFGSPEQSIPISYWTIVNALETQEPEVVVFDVTMFNHSTAVTDKDHLHYALDSFPLSIQKIKAIDDSLDSVNEKIEMVFPLGTYHSTWENLSQDNFIDTSKFIKGSMSYGFSNCMKVASFGNNRILEECSNLDTNDPDLIYLQKIIDLCKERKIPLLLIATPSVCESKRQKDLNAISKFAENNGVEFLNLIKMDFVIDMKIDLYDVEHVNQSGLHKMSTYLGSYLMNNYNISSHQNDTKFAYWEKDYQNYKELKYESICWMTEDIQSMLQCLHDKDISSYVFVGKNSISDSKLDIVYTLLQNINRENLTIESDNVKSQDIFPLSLSKDTLLNNSYLLISNQNDSVEEFYGEEAKELFTDTLEDSINIDSIDNSISVLLIDDESEKALLVRSYNSDYGYTDYYTDITQKYFN